MHKMPKCPNAKNAQNAQNVIKAQIFQILNTNNFFSLRIVNKNSIHIYKKKIRL